MQIQSWEENNNSDPTVAKFPEAADLFNRLKARRKKSKADLGVLEILDHI
ncbi:hypothetical protein IQ270_08060 [Microcoleus sp. LEGE 07076]|nr:hypothetical protein [Microcoleus sp. LEGE 07076]MBE9184674.1 hypothetical protein [Microcoleus sp. LEGE 07076]